MPSGRGLVHAGRAAVVLALLLAAAVGWRLSGAGGPGGGGGLQVPPPHGWTDVKPVGTTFTNGIISVRNWGEQPVVLVSVSPQTSGAGLRYLGAKVAGAGREYSVIDTLPGFPPVDAALPDVAALEGAVVPSGESGRTEGVELLMGFEVVAPGRSVMTSVDLRYTVGGRKYEQQIPSTMVICTDRAEPCDDDS